MLDLNDDFSRMMVLMMDTLSRSTRFTQIVRSALGLRFYLLEMQFFGSKFFTESQHFAKSLLGLYMDNDEFWIDYHTLPGIIVYLWSLSFFFRGIFYAIQLLAQRFFSKNQQLAKFLLKLYIKCRIFWIDCYILPEILYIYV